MTGLKHKADFRPADVGKIVQPVRPIIGRVWPQFPIPQALRATLKTASGMRNTVSRIEECKPCVAGVGPACHGVGHVVRALLRPSVRIRGCIRALCQTLVDSGRGGCSVTMAAALRKSERRSPPEGGKTLSIKHIGGLLEPKNRFKSQASAPVRR